MYACEYIFLVACSDLGWPLMAISVTKTFEIQCFEKGFGEEWLAVAGSYWSMWAMIEKFRICLSLSDAVSWAIG